MELPYSSNVSMTPITTPNRACFDDRCAPRATCLLWTQRDSPGFAIRSMTWRAHWRCHDSPCDYHIPATSELGALLATADETATPSTS